jgi:hypothetical protein
MHTFDVVDRSAEAARLALRCNFGRYHHARPLNAVPPLGGFLQGARPRLGFSILVCLDSGLVYRVIFESVNDAALRAGWANASGAELFRGEAPGHA